MKPTTALILGAGALAILFIWSRSSNATTLSGVPSSSATTRNLLTLGGAALGGATAGLLISPGANSSTSTNTSNSIAAQNTADFSQASNYIADSTAASDTSSGVVGFGGWDD